MGKLFKILASFTLIALLGLATHYNVTPVYAATATFYPDAHAESSSVDGAVARDTQTYTWATIRNSAGTYADDDNAYTGIVIDEDVASYYTYLSRGIAIFNTATLPDNATITSATLSLYGYSKLDENNWQPNVNIYSVTTASSTAIGTGDYLYTNFGTTAYSTAIAYNNWSVSGYNTFTLNSSGLAHISLTGVTKFGIRNANYDVANNPPFLDNDIGSTYLFWYTADQAGTSYDPVLTITYYIITAPEVVANEASNVGQTTARLNSTLSNDGNEECEIRFGYGDETQTAENFELYDTVTAWVDGYESGEHPYVDIDSLVADTTYHFRVQAKNTAGTTTSDEVDFVTEASLSAPTNLRSIPTSESIDLTWTKGTGAATTLIRYAFDTYPAAVDEGTELYSSSGSSVSHTGLASGRIVYYTAWSESGGSYSDAVNLLATTLAGTSADVSLDVPSEPTNWFLEVDYTTMSNFEPVYGTTNDIIDGLGMPRTTGWMIIGVLVPMTGAFVVYAKRQNMMASGVVMIFLMAIASSQWLVPGWILLMTIVILIAIGINQGVLRT